MDDAAPSPHGSRRPTPAVLAAVALIVLHLALGLWCARRMSVTYDEFAHLPAGAAYLREGALEIYNLSPPLPRYLAAAPLALGADAVVPPAGPFVALPPGARHWAYGDAFMRANAADYHGTFLPARAMMTLLSCAGAAIAFAWARAIAGDAAGLAACALYVTCPNLVAQASIVGTDSASAVALLAGAWRLDRYVRAPTLARGAAMLVLLAAAPMVKFSLLAAWPIAGVLLVAFALRRRITWRAALAPIALLPVAGFAACWLSYVGQPAGASLAELGATTAGLTAWLDRAGLGGVARLFPRPLVEGFDRQLFESAGQFDGFLFGREYAGAAWGYYPTAALCKWTIGMLALCALALWLGVRRRAWPAVVPAVAAAGYALLFTFSTQINIGSRYLLPVLPLAFVAAVATVWRLGGVRIRRASVALVALAGVEGLSSMPDPIAFYNLAAWGTGVANRQYIDGDGGQSLIVLREWMQRNGVDRVRLAHFSCVNPTVYGIAYDEFDDPRSRAEWMALSGQLANRAVVNLAVPAGGTRTVEFDPAVGLRMRESSPDARAGAFYLYRVRPAATAPAR